MEKLSKIEINEQKQIEKATNKNKLLEDVLKKVQKEEETTLLTPVVANKFEKMKTLEHLEDRIDNKIKEQETNKKEDQVNKVKSINQNQAQKNPDSVPTKLDTHTDKTELAHSLSVLLNEKDEDVKKILDKEEQKEKSQIEDLIKLKKEYHNTVYNMLLILPCLRVTL